MKSPVISAQTPIYLPGASDTGWLPLSIPPGLGKTEVLGRVALGLNLKFPPLSSFLLVSSFAKVSESPFQPQQ